jgi:hypothetical protein
MQDMKRNPLGTQKYWKKRKYVLEMKTSASKNTHLKAYPVDHIKLNTEYQDLKTKLMY